MTRSDTMKRLASICRSSHAATLLAVGWLLSDADSESLDQLLELLEESAGVDPLLNHLMRYEALIAERYGSQS